VKTPLRLISPLLALVLLSCSSKPIEEKELDPKARRARDSAIGQMPIPGAQGVRGALRASDSIASRLKRIDSAGQQP
jgi:hypothetical protein